MPKIDVDARFDFTPAEAKAKIIDAIDEFSTTDRPLKLNWQRDMAASVHGRDFSGAIVITQSMMHVTLTLPWFLSGLTTTIDKHICGALKDRGFIIL